MVAICIGFAESAQAKLKAEKPEKDLQIHLRTQLAKACELREDAILMKYKIGKEEYGSSLKHYSNDP